MRWSYGGPNELEPRDENFHGHVADFLNRDTAVWQAIIAWEAEIMIELSEVQVFPLPERACWVICNPSGRNLPLPDWNCYQAIAKALLAMPMLADE